MPLADMGSEAVSTPGAGQKCLTPSPSMASSLRCHPQASGTPPTCQGVLNAAAGLPGRGRETPVESATAILVLIAVKAIALHSMDCPWRHELSPVQREKVPERGAAPVIPKTKRVREGGSVEGGGAGASGAHWADREGCPGSPAPGKGGHPEPWTDALVRPIYGKYVAYRHFPDRTWEVILFKTSSPSCVSEILI